MRIDVLNGVNLNLLGRRDQATYGDQSIQDLETQVYAWARDLDLQVRCRQTNHEGEYVGFLHQALGTADGLIVNPGAWTHYSWAIHDALEPFTVPFVEVHLSNVDEREEWRRHSVLTGLGGMRVVGQGVRGLPRGSRLARRAAPVSRVARLAASLSEPLLVTDGVNVQYLLGFESSNCAVLVEPGGAATLYTDFRYLEAARAVDGVEVVQTRRDVAGALAELLAGRRIGFEASRISYAHWQTLAEGGVDLVPTRGLVEAFRLVKDDAEIDAIRRASSHLGRGVRRTGEGAVHRPHGEGARLVDRADVPGARRGRPRLCADRGFRAQRCLSPCAPR